MIDRSPSPDNAKLLNSWLQEFQHLPDTVCPDEQRLTQDELQSRLDNIKGDPTRTVFGQGAVRSPYATPRQPPGFSGQASIDPKAMDHLTRARTLARAGTQDGHAIDLYLRALTSVPWALILDPENVAGLREALAAVIQARDAGTPLALDQVDSALAIAQDVLQRTELVDLRARLSDGESGKRNKTPDELQALALLKTWANQTTDTPSQTDRTSAAHRLEKLLGQPPEHARFYMWSIDWGDAPPLPVLTTAAKGARLHLNANEFGRCASPAATLQALAPTELTLHDVNGRVPDWLPKGSTSLGCLKLEGDGPLDANDVRGIMLDNPSLRLFSVGERTVDIDPLPPGWSQRNGGYVNTDAQSRYLVLARACTSLRLKLTPAALNQLIANDPEGHMFAYLKNFNDVVYLSTHTNDARRDWSARLSRIVQSAADHPATLARFLEILQQREPACLDDCVEKLAQMEFCQVTGDLKSVPQVAAAALLRGLCNAALSEALQRHPADPDGQHETLETHMVLSYAIYQLIAQKMDIASFKVPAPIFQTYSNITPAEASEMARQLLRDEISQGFPASRYAIGFDPASSDALQAALKRTDRDYPKQAARIETRYQQDMQLLPLDDLTDAHALQQGEQLTREKDEKLERLPAERVTRLLAAQLKSR